MPTPSVKNYDDWARNYLNLDNKSTADALEMIETALSMIYFGIDPKKATGSNKTIDELASEVDDQITAAYTEPEEGEDEAEQSFKYIRALQTQIVAKATARIMYHLCRQMIIQNHPTLHETNRNVAGNASATDTTAHNHASNFTVAGETLDTGDGYHDWDTDDDISS